MNELFRPFVDRTTISHQSFSCDPERAHQPFRMEEAMMALAMDVRDLTVNEVDEVNGAIAANLLGGVIGGVSAGFGAAVAGGSGRSIAAAAVGGAVVGLILPGSAAVGAARMVSVSVGRALRTVGREVAANAAGGAASTAISG